MKSKSLRLYVLLVAAAAVAALFLGSQHDVSGRSGILLPLIAVTCIAGAFPVRIPGLRLEVAPIDAFILVGVAAFGPMPAVLICIGGVLGAAIGRRAWPATIRLAFNLAALSLSAIAAWGVYSGLGGQAVQPLVARLLPLTLAALTYSLVNSGLVALAVRLEKRQSLLRTWVRLLACNASGYLIGLGTAVAMLALLDATLLWALAFSIVPVRLVVIFYRSWGAKHVLESA